MGDDVIEELRRDERRPLAEELVEERAQRDEAL
jgi:hypothetical protein